MRTIDRCLGQQRSGKKKGSQITETRVSWHTGRPCHSAAASEIVRFLQNQHVVWKDLVFFHLFALKDT